MRKSTFVAAIVASSTALAAFAHGGATGVVKERMDAMADMGEAVKTIAPMMQGEVAYDAEIVRQAAETFSRHAGDTMTALFPEGSGGAPSVAKEAVWSKWEEFSELADRLGVVAEGLVLAADNGLMAAGGDGASSDTMMSGANMMGGGAMMGGSNMMGAGATPEAIAGMPADGAFTMLSQVCAACHTQFRAESK
ncbi:MAG: cytochrome c [Maritimibacter sp.]|nr:cytochrome c [Maritimibacter sp.]